MSARPTLSTRAKATLMALAAVPADARVVLTGEAQLRTHVVLERHGFVRIERPQLTPSLTPKGRLFAHELAAEGP